MACLDALRLMLVNSLCSAVTLAFQVAELPCALVEVRCNGASRCRRLH